jgi:hypothetical protein
MKRSYCDLLEQIEYFSQSGIFVERVTQKV